MMKLTRTRALRNWRPDTTRQGSLSRPHAGAAVTVLPPLVSFAIARIVVWGASASVGLGWPDARDLTRRDSNLYLSIAHHGYTLFPCDRVGGWCGNAGWLPGYPLLVALPFHLGSSGPVAGAVLSAVLQLATLVLLWRRLVARTTDLVVPLLALLAAAVFPGVVYQAAVFPMSLLATFVLAGLALENRHRYLAAACCLFAATTHPLGVALSIALAVAAALPRATRDMRRAGMYLGSGTAGVAGVAVAQWIAVGHLNAYLLVQRHYDHSGTSPFGTFRLAKESTLTFLRDPNRLDLVPQVQLVVVAIFVVAVVIATILNRHRLVDGDLALAVFTVCAWVAPLLLGGVSLYRSDAALLPALALARRLPRVMIASFVVVATPLAFEISRLFFTGVLA
jgi:hypothetical protein